MKTLTLTLALALATPAFAGAYDAATDFSTTTQGNNGWTYGYDAANNGSVTNLSWGTTFWGYEAWRDSTCTEASWRAGSGTLLGHPASVNGCNGATVLTFTSPESGTATASVSLEMATFDCVGLQGDGVEAELVDPEGNVLASGAVTYGNPLTWNGSLTLFQGDQLSLSFTDNAHAWCDTTVVSFAVAVDLQADADGDGVPDLAEAYVDSATGPESGYANHGKYVSAVVRAAQEARKLGYLTGDEFGLLVAERAH